MNKTATNLIVILGIITVVFGAYFFFTQDSTMLFQSSRSDQQLQQLLASSQLFVERSRALSQITIDTQILDSEVFNSLKVYSPPPEEYGVGRTNPFAPTAQSVPINVSETR